MPILFEGNAGRVFSVPDRVATGLIQMANVTGEGGQLTYATHSTIITGMGIGSSGNYQFLHTLGNDVYIYVFGDRVGQLELRGLSFASTCPNTGAADYHGFEKLLRWYNNNRLARRKTHVRSIIGRSTVIDGFVTSLNAVGDDAQTRSVRFTMSITLLP